jgi:tetratricopeptide (TPR) repeat protein
MLYIRTETFELASPLLERAIEMEPNSSLVHWAYAEMYDALNQAIQAIPHYAKALNLLDGDERKDEIKIKYARSLASLGEHDKAESLLSELLKVPGQMFNSIIYLTENPNCNSDSPVTKLIKDLLATEDSDADAKSKLHLAMGRIQERSKDYDCAFNHWIISKSLKTQDKFNVAAFAGSINHVVEFYTPQRLRSLGQTDSETELPVFVFGMPRSGTTLTEQIMAAHSRVRGAGELLRMEHYEKAYFAKFGEQENNTKFLGAEQIKRSSSAYLNLLSKVTEGSPDRVVDKTVSNYLVAGYIHMCFPKARFVNCMRHPADSFISAYQNNLARPEFYDQESYAAYFLGKEKLVQHWRACFPERVFDLCYEELVSNPESVVRRLIAFLGLEWDSNCMKFFEQKTTVKTLSLHQVRQPIYTSSVYRWKNYEKHLGPLFAAFKEANYTYPEF